LALLVIFDRTLPGRPAALFVAVPATLLVWAAGLEAYGVVTVGELPAGLPALRRPPLGFRDVDGVVPLAAACFLLSYVESISAARTLAGRHGYEISPRRELLGLGAANLAAAFFQGFPVAGGLSQSAVNDKAGARSRMALVVASITIGVCLVFLTGPVRYMPNVVLAAIVLNAVFGLIDVAALRRLWQISRFEFAVASVALAGVLVLGILDGVLLAVVVSLLMLLSQAARPHVAILGRIPGTHRFSDLDRHPTNQAIAGLLIFRVESALLYFNTEHVRTVVRTRIAASEGLKLVICDLSNSPQVDVGGAAMLSDLHRELSARGIGLRVVEAHGDVRHLLRAAGLEAQVGHIDRRQSLDATVAEFEQLGPATPSESTS
jgi:MFS superfamily sulfate permease-like transporter